MNELLIEKSSNLIDNPGRSHIQRVLRTHNNPAEALLELQETFGLNYTSKIALPFLDLLEVSRSSVYQTLYESAKIKLEGILQNLSQEMLLKMLSQTFRFITVKDLKSIPLSVIKRLGNIPEKYLKALASKKLQGILEEIPNAVRRQVWGVDSSHFLQTVSEHSFKWIKSAKEDGNLRPDHSIESICEIIGDSKYLFTQFANFCIEKVLSDENEILWSTLLRHTVTGIPKEKIPALAKLRDFSLQIDQAIRESSINHIVVRNLVNYIKDIRRAYETIQNGVISHIHSNPHNQNTNTNHNHNHSDILSTTTTTTTTTITKKILPPSAPPVNRQKRPQLSELTIQLKELVTTLKEKKEFKFFLSPAVDQIVEKTAKEFYLQTITSPLDLGKISKQISKYESIEQLESDIKLMLNNCRIFNGPGYLTDIANECWRIWLQVKESSNKLKRIKPSEINNTNDDKVTESEVQVNKLSSSSSSTSYLSNPQIKSINTSNLTTSQPSTQIETKTETIEKKKTKSTQETTLSSSSSSSSSSSPTIKTSTINNNESSSSLSSSSLKSIEQDTVPLSDKITNAWKYITSLDENHFFAAPVAEQYPEIAREYLKIISNPIDLRTIKEKIPSYRTFVAFCDDIALMFRNAENFNKHDKYILQIIRSILNKWKKEKSSFAVGKIVATKEPEIPVELTPISDADKAEVNPNITDLRKSINVALDYLTKIDKTSIFATPVTIPGYTDIIKNPRDLHSIRSNFLKYRTIEQFEDDIKLMYQNCIVFNTRTGDKIYVNLAIRFWNLWKENRKKILLEYFFDIDEQEEKELMEIAHHSDEDDEDDDEDWSKQQKNEKINGSNKNKNNNSNNDNANNNNNNNNNNNSENQNNKTNKSNETSNNTTKSESNGTKKKKKIERNDENDHDDENDVEDEIIVKKRKKVQSDVNPTKKQTISNKSSSKESKSSLGSKSKGQSTGGAGAAFVKPLPLHLQSLSSTKPIINPLSTQTTINHNENKLISSTPSIESLLTSLTSSSSSSSTSTSTLSNLKLQNSMTQAQLQSQIQFSKDVLSWAIIIIKDKQLEVLFEKYFVVLLNTINNENLLPSNDENMINLLHLIQYKLQNNIVSHELNQSLLRNIIPLIILSSNNINFTDELTPEIIEKYFINNDKIFNQDYFINFIMKIYNLFKEKIQSNNNNNSNNNLNSSNKPENILETSLLNI